MSARKTSVRAAATSKGDLPVATASDAWGSRTVGADGQIVGADSTDTTGLKYYNRSRVIGSVSADATAVNTTAETTLATIAIPTNIVAGDVLRLRLVGDMLNSSGSTATMKIRVYLGATVILDGGTASLTTLGNRRGWLADIDILVVATNDQRSSWSYTIGTGSFSSAQGVGTNISARGTTATEDLTAGKSLAVTVVLGTAAANIDAILHEAFLTVVRA